MNRIDKTFCKLKKQKKKAFIPYVTAGDPDIATTKKIVKALVRAGSDIIELGMPFSDPLADGPTIQRAVYRSLEAGCSARKIFRMVRELRKNVDIPLVFMTYYNIVFNYGIKRFTRDAKNCGADGIIVADLPMEESGELASIADKMDFSVILLAAPTTPVERFRKIAERSSGFIYYVSLTGVTGARKVLAKRLVRDVRILKKVTSKPICVGFGVSKPRQAKEIARAGDGVIVGSAIINVLEKNTGNKKKMVREIEAFVRSLARAVHSA